MGGRKLTHRDQGLVPIAEYVSVLIEGRKIIGSSERWTQHYSARDANGEPVHPNCPSARCFCAVGVICHLRNVSMWDEDIVATEALQALRAEADSRYPQETVAEHVNDVLGHEAVLALFDAAIAKAEGRS